MSSTQLSLSYARLFRGEISQKDAGPFFASLFALDVDRSILESQLRALSKDQLLLPQVLGAFEPR